MGYLQLVGLDQFLRYLSTRRWGIMSIYNFLCPLPNLPLETAWLEWLAFVSQVTGSVLRVWRCFRRRKNFMWAYCLMKVSLVKVPRFGSSPPPLVSADTEWKWQNSGYEYHALESSTYVTQPSIMFLTSKLQMPSILLAILINIYYLSIIKQRSSFFSNNNSCNDFRLDGDISSPTFSSLETEVSFRGK